MHIFYLDNIVLTHPGGRVLFDKISWAIHDDARIGLIGINGAGKSTLLKIIAGTVKPESGTATPLRGVTVGYLPQEVDLPDHSTLLAEALSLPPQLAEVEARLRAIEDKLGDPSVYNDADKLTRVLAQQERALAEYEQLGGDRHESTVREILAHLGFEAGDMDLPSATLSGGQKKLVALTKLAAERPSILLLDEPDNHLDLAAKQKLESFLARYEGAVIIVSHDRYLLDEVVHEIAELDDATIDFYKGNYTAYTTEKELRRLRQQQLYVAQQKEITRIQEAIARFELWASIVIDERHIKQARSRQKMLDRMEERGEIIEKVKTPKDLPLQLNGWRGSNKVLEVRDLAMGFDDDLLFVDLNFTLYRGQRVGLVGDNGMGKSVLFKLLTNEYAPLAGEVIYGPSVKMGYYAQEHQTIMPWYDRTPIDLVRATVPISEGEAVAFLINMLFGYEQTRQPIRTMSGGERSRLQLLKLMLEKPNLLLLDEPTNNLDIRSAEALERALADFEGAVVIISHDRYFLDQAVDEVYELHEGNLTIFNGGYTDYLAQRTTQPARP